MPKKTPDGKRYKDRITAEKLLLQVPSHGYTMNIACLSQRGYYPEAPNKANQDSYCACPNFLDNADRHFFGVFDGHGEDGDHCSIFAKDRVPLNFSKILNNQSGVSIDKAYTKAFVDSNTEMHGTPFDDVASGTTAICVLFDGRTMHIANVGDSRAVVAELKGDKLVAFPLSIDQTPYRKDERERIKKAGGRIMSVDQLQGVAPMHENWGLNLGEEIDDEGDPPRVWVQDGAYPGVAFTRSLGDQIAESVGCHAQPELMTKDLADNAKFVIIASDGVWEFLTSQAVVDMVAKFEDPMAACEAVVSQAYRLWLQYDVRTDDITMICSFLAGLDSQSREQKSPGPAAGADQGRGEVRGNVELLAAGEKKPVRRGFTREKRKSIMDLEAATKLTDEELKYDITKNAQVVPKTQLEISRLEVAVRANFLFAHLGARQREDIFNVMEVHDVRRGDVVIRQGDPGDRFYIVDDGEFDVLVCFEEGQAAEVVHHYSTAGGTHPSFGELSLMYGKPRQATVQATRDGRLWSLDRRAFRATLMKTSHKELLNVLRSVEILRSLSMRHLQRLADMLQEAHYNDGEAIIRQGETGDQFYVLKKGSAICTIDDKVVMTLKQNDYFGERALLQDAPRAANVIAQGPVTCLHIGRVTFEEVLGSLQDIIDEDRQRRELACSAKSSQIYNEAMKSMEALADLRLNDLQWKQHVIDLDLGHMGMTKCAIDNDIYALKIVSKEQIVLAKQQQQIMRERDICFELSCSSRFVAPVLATFQNSAALFTLLKAKIVTDMVTVVHDKQREKVCRFYAASLVLALTFLQDEGVLSRAIAPEFIALDEQGYLQLHEFRFAKKIDNQRTYSVCGTAEYLAPEQIGGQGHGLAVDFWALGIFMFELLHGRSPFAVDGGIESDVYNKIVAHKRGQLQIDGSIGDDCKDLIEELLCPNEDERLGCSGTCWAKLSCLIASLAKCMSLSVLPYPALH